MKKLNKAGPSTDPWGTPLVTGLSGSANKSVNSWCLSWSVRPQVPIILNSQGWEFRRFGQVSSICVHIYVYVGLKMQVSTIQ